MLPEPPEDIEERQPLTNINELREYVLSLGIVILPGWTDEVLECLRNGKSFDEIAEEFELETMPF